MKRILTAIGNEELNNILRMQKDIEIAGTDIQYQEGILEALEEYQNIDIVILKEDIIGELNIEELIRSIIILRNDIEVILIAEQLQELKNIKNITKIVDDKNNYVDIVIKYLIGNVYINKQRIFTLQEIEQDRNNMEGKIQKEKIKMQYRNRAWLNFDKIRKNIKNIFKKREKKKEIITVIGSPGIRKDKFYINTFKNF